jgi:ferredoxin--NADP+ reductase
MDYQMKEKNSMYQILNAKELAANIFWMEVEAKRIAKSAQPGQFVIVRTDEGAERIPLTICDYNREKGTITIVFQIVGAATLRMSKMQAGDAFVDFVGPLGNESEFVTLAKTPEGL